MQPLAQQTRRYFLGKTGLGVGAAACHTLMASEDASADQRAPSRHALAAKPPMIPAKAKSVIYLHMAGSPSQLELFENKPALKKYHDKPCPQEYLEGKRFAFIKGVPKMLAGQFAFRQHGEAGQWISELLPKFSEVADQACIIRTVNTDQFNHSPAQLLLHTGQPRLGNPSMGSWVTWGLGSESQNLPGFVVLASGGKTPSAGKSLWGSGFLPTVYQGVQCRTDGDPVLYLSDPRGMTRKQRRKTLDALRDLNKMQFEQVGDQETQTRIAQYELAFRMQTAVPEVMDISREPQHILDLYGAQPGYVSPAESADDPRVLYKGDDPTFANNCLLARRLVEQGVRFVQLYDWGWDHHGTSPGESIDETLPIKTRQIDRAIAGLIRDLEQRGLLDSTLIVWGGEFGRTPMMQNNKNTEITKGFVGRDHHPYAYTMWMAGGGVKAGVAYGQTDDIGYYIAENPVGIRDLQATILHLLGLDPHRFSYAYQGLQQRLIGPTSEGQVITDIVA
ncbi:MAG: sulfatase [Blastopirellula sp.]|nr:sulfatase [Blastopirellula sp.]